MKFSFRSIIARCAVIIVFCCVFGLFVGVTANLYTVFHGITPVAYAQKLLSRPDGRIKKVLFSPDDNAEFVLRGLFQEAHRSIKIAAFALTSKVIADEIIAARKRGVHVEIVADGEASDNEYSKIGLLKKERIPIYLFRPKKTTRDWRALMHNKFIIFEYTIGARPLIWTGSFNFTRSANERNQENVIILDDAEIVASYKNHYEELKNRCRQPASRDSKSGESTPFQQMLAALIHIF